MVAPGRTWSKGLAKHVLLEEWATEADSTMLAQLKVILTTNVAETALTLPNVKFVMDFGLVTLSHGKVLRTVWTAKQNIQQRRGRAGRTSDGECFAVYSRDLYDALDEVDSGAEADTCRLSCQGHLWSELGCVAGAGQPHQGHVRARAPRRDLRN